MEDERIKDYLVRTFGIKMESFKSKKSKITLKLYKNYYMYILMYEYTVYQIY